MTVFALIFLIQLRRELSYDDILLILFSLFSLILMHYRRLVVSSQIFRLLMGKTFLWNTIITTPRSDARIVLAIASLGVTPFLFPRGRTGH
uniref:ATP-dependent DNA helicase n=1 Tax=Aegilops tauschii subsp. strangulata TaxID=200361 RepID=A0A453P4K0_AEGTS